MIHFILIFSLVSSSFAQLKSKEGFQTSEDDLIHWTNGQFDIARTQQVQVGESLTLMATEMFPGSKIWGKCIWITPKKETWLVGDQVTDTDGNVVPGVDPLDAGERSCGIVIKNAAEQNLGGWECVYFSDISIGVAISTDNDVGGLRLPETFIPRNYEVTLIPDLESQGNQHAFEGSVKMFVEAVENTPIFTFHSDGLSILEVLAFSVGDEIVPLPLGSGHLDFQRTFVSVSPPDGKEFKSGTLYEFDVKFETNQTRGPYYSYGFYHRVCSDAVGDTKQCWYTQFESTNARNAFPCLDEPALKATFSVSVARTDDYHSHSNMPLIFTFPIEGQDGWVLDVFDTTVEMSPYLVAVGVTDYAPIKSDTDNTTVWAPKADIDAGRGDYAIDIGPKIIKFYEEYFNVRYSLPKMDLMYEVAKGGAMENWGLILFDPRALMLDADADDNTRWTVLSVTAHELAHQWFGNLVTVDWWSQTWLNEGFATYVSYLGTDYIDPDIHSWARLYVRETQRVMMSDEDTSKHWAMSDDVTDRNDIERKFGSFTYQKGGSVIRMMEQILSKETFTKGLTSYLTALSYSSATEDDLFFHLEEAAVADGKWPQPNGPGFSFGEVMKSWTNQAGLPVIHAVKTSNEDNPDKPYAIHFNQSWLVSNEATSEERRWDVPLTFTSVGAEPNPGWDIGLPQAWINHDQTEVIIECDDNLPFVVNIQGTGYYRVNYEEGNWEAIASVLKDNRDLIHPMNRAQIICDVVALAETGHVTTAIKDDVLSYVDMETEFAPLYAYGRCASGFKEMNDVIWRI